MLKETHLLGKKRRRRRRRGGARYAEQAKGGSKNARSETGFVGHMHKLWPLSRGNEGTGPSNMTQKIEHKKAYLKPGPSLVIRRARLNPVPSLGDGSWSHVVHSPPHVHWRLISYLKSANPPARVTGLSVSAHILNRVIAAGMDTRKGGQPLGWMPESPCQVRRSQRQKRRE